MKVMPFAGKTNNNKVRGVAVSESGAVQTNRQWTIKETYLFDYVEIRDTEVRTSFDVHCDCSDAAMVSLRISNNLDVNVEFNLCHDLSAGSTYVLKDISGNYITFTARPGMTIVTPDDIPALKYLKYIKLRMVAKTAPTSGGISVIAVAKA